MWDAIMFGFSVFLILLVGIGTAWTVISVEMTEASRREFRKWAIDYCYTFLMLMVMPGVLVLCSVIPSSAVIVGGGSVTTTVLFAAWFFWLGQERHKLNPRKPQ